VPPGTLPPQGKCIPQIPGGTFDANFCAFWCADRTASKFITAQLACSVQSRGRTLWETASSTSTNTHCGTHCGTQMEHAPLTGCLTWSQKLCCIIYQRMPWTASANFAAKKHSKRLFLWKSPKIYSVMEFHCEKVQKSIYYLSLLSFENVKKEECP